MLNHLELVDITPQINTDIFFFFILTPLLPTTKHKILKNTKKKVKLILICFRFEPNCTQMRSMILILVNIYILFEYI